MKLAPVHHDDIVPLSTCTVRMNSSNKTKSKFLETLVSLDTVGHIHVHVLCGVSWPSGLAYRTQVLVLAAECGFESRP